MTDIPVMKEIFGSFPVVIERPVAWGEMDAFQHVNNIIYFRYFESARICYFEQVGLLRLMDETGIGPILASTHCRFRIPLAYPDTVSIGAKITEIGEDRFTMHYRVASHRHQKIAAEGDGILVTYNYRENRKVSVPETLRKSIEAMERPGGFSAGGSNR